MELRVDGVGTICLLCLFVFLAFSNPWWPAIPGFVALNNSPTLYHAYKVRRSRKEVAE